MVRKPAKIEIYIIVASLILSAAVLGGFWLRNKVPFASSAVNLPPSESTPEPTAETKVEPAQTEPETVETVSLRGLSKILEPGKLNALVLGDSIAESKGASNRESSWYSSVARGLQSKYPGTLEWSFVADQKFTVNDILAKLPELSPNSDVIFISLGRNDSTILKLEDFKQKYQQLLEKLQTKTPHADIFLIVEPPVKNIPANNQFFPYRQVTLELGKQYELPVIDGWQTFINDPAPLSSLLVDGVNPNDTGYRILADAVMKSFKESLMAKP